MSPGRFVRGEGRCGDTQRGMEHKALWTGPTSIGTFLVEVFCCKVARSVWTMSQDLGLFPS
jgi:hypothetical protein